MPNDLIDDLLLLKLQPREFMVACTILSKLQDGVMRVTTEEVAQTIGSVYSTAAKSIVILIDMGVFTRPNRGSYLLGKLSVGRVFVEPPSPKLSVGRVLPVEPISTKLSVGRVLPPKLSVGRVSWPISSTSSKEASRSGSVSDPNGSLTSGASAGKRTRKYDYENEGSDIGVVGRTGPAPSLPERSTRKHDLKVHRTIPREKWDEAFVAKEFRHRMVLECPDIRDVGVDSKNLTRGLQGFRNNFGVTVATMATAVDLFFDTGRAASLSVGDVPYRRFLAYLRDHTRSIEDTQVTPEEQAETKKAWEDILNG